MSGRKDGYLRGLVELNVNLSAVNDLVNQLAVENPRYKEVTDWSAIADRGHRGADPQWKGYTNENEETAYVDWNPGMEDSFCLDALVSKAMKSSLILDQMSGGTPVDSHHICHAIRRLLLDARWFVDWSFSMDRNAPFKKRFRKWAKEFAWVRKTIISMVFGLSNGSVMEPFMPDMAKQLGHEITSNPGRTAKELSLIIDKSEEYTRYLISEYLLPIGFYNRKGGKGYFPRLEKQ